MRKTILSLMVLLTLVSSLVLGAPIIDDPFIEQTEPTLLDRFSSLFQTQAIAVNPTQTNVFEPGGKVNFVLDEVANADCTVNTRFVVFIDGPNNYHAEEVGISSQGSTVTIGSFLTDFFVWNVPSSVASGTYEITNYYICGTTTSSPKISGTNVLSVVITGGAEICQDQSVGERFCNPSDDAVVQNKQRTDCTLQSPAPIIEQCSGGFGSCVNGQCVTLTQTQCQADLDGQICTSSQICITGSQESGFIETSDTSRCCIFGACGTQEDLEANQKPTPRSPVPSTATQIGIRQEAIKGASLARLKQSTCSGGNQCLTGTCVNYFTGEEILGVLDIIERIPGGNLFRWLVERLSPTEIGVVEQVLEEEASLGFCIINFKPTEDTSGGENIRPSIKESELSRLTGAQLLESACLKDNQCSDEGICIRFSSLKDRGLLEEPKSFADKIDSFLEKKDESFIFKIPIIGSLIKSTTEFVENTYGICVLEETKDCSSFVKKVAIFGITGEECTDGFIVLVGGGILLLFLLVIFAK